MVVRGRIKPIAVIAGLLVMLAALLFVALDRSHEVAPKPPLHQTR